ncbi:UDP-glucuronosyltransferase 2B17-like [Acanthaster planci]|uniref:UDP-glucuronosyltransferase 2B17-like n=1 Tax=Acanthaster planci TaxID=133434 RepID=A0A8B7XTF3_ACAPL|nr:UDP-glucuronosyltransferase 2B17-like [Acanthaster planci]
MSSKLFRFLLLITTCFPVVSISSICGEQTAQASKRYKFLYFVSPLEGSHYLALSMSGKELVKQGHKVVSLVSSSNSRRLQTADADFSVVVFNSSYTREKRAAVMEKIGKVLATGAMRGFFGHLECGIKGNLAGELNVAKMWLRECDDLLGDNATMRRLRQERFDMMVADDSVRCIPLLAQALNIPFIYSIPVHTIPSKHSVWAGLPIEPSYVPEAVIGLTDRMTFLQRVQNVLAYEYYKILWSLAEDRKGFDQLKVKYNIRPEISTYESHKQASLYLCHGSFALEFPRPVQPNTVYVLQKAGSTPHTKTEDDIASFLDTAPNGVVLFSLGTYTSCMELQKAQVIADGFALLSQRVLWQSKALPAGVKLANNTKTVGWLPLAKIMEHANVKVFVSHGGSFSMYEAMWAGLPMVGLPLFGDQMGNFDRLEDRGVGLALDITTLTPESFSQSIQKVISDPKFRDNARRISMIMRDMQVMSPPVKTVAHWILHVTKFGGDHLRPAVLDLNFIQRNLLDVYLFIVAVLALFLGLNFYLCYCCCKCMCVKAWKSHLKKD